MTNRERINQMTDEELSEVIMCPFEFDDGFRKRCERYGNTKNRCTECCTEYLKQEADNG